MNLKYHVSVDPGAANESRAKLARLVGEGKKVLDLGCHAGDLAQVLGRQGCRVWGVDIDAEAAQLAEKSCSEVTVADLDTLDPAGTFGSERFDVVALGDVLEHLADPLRVLTMSRGLLAPGGFILISVPNIAHVSVRLMLLRGEFPSDPVGIMDRTHRCFFTRSSLARLLAEARLYAQVWDQVSTAWPADRVREELAQMGVPASAELIGLLTGPEASAYQYVAMARPATDAEKKTTLVLVCPDKMPAPEIMRGWRDAAGGSRELVAAVSSDALDRSGTISQGTLFARIITFGDDRSIGAALNSALPSSPAGAVIFVHAGVRPERALVEALEGAVERADPRDFAGAFAESDPGRGAGREWWISQAHPPQRVKDAGLEFCRGLNLGVNAAWFAQSRFAEDLPFPWVMAEWLNQAVVRGFKFIKVQGPRARLEFSPGLAALSAEYRRTGRMLASLREDRPGFVQRRLPPGLPAGKILKQALRGIMARVSPASVPEKYFERLRAQSLRRGYEQGRAR